VGRTLDIVVSVRTHPRLGGMARRPEAPKRQWRRWHYFAIAVLGVILIGGVSALLSGEAPTPGPTPTVSVSR